MSDNLELYNNVREVPHEAKKNITGGRLKGMTDINPMWRIKTLTEQFGACGKGWYIEIKDKQIIEGANNEKVAFVDIYLYVKFDNEWSKPIFGTGGSSFVAKESRGMYTSDECYKMALTDAISVACKSLGIGADVYFEKDRTKYDAKLDAQERETKTTSSKITDKQLNNLMSLINQLGDKKEFTENLLKYYKVDSLNEMSNQQYAKALKSLQKRLA